MKKSFNSVQFFGYLKLSNIPIPLAEYRFHPIRRVRFDWAWPEIRVAMECQGATYSAGKHGRGSGLAKDREKLNLAAAMGWLVLQFTPQELAGGLFTDVLADAIRVASNRDGIFDLDDIISVPYHLRTALDTE